MKNVFLFGYYGFENTGDEAMLQVIVQQFRRVLPEVKLTALTYRAKDTIERYGIDAVSRNHFKGVVDTIKRSDFVISGGGSLLQDVTSSRSLIYYLAIIYLAKRLGKKVMFYGNGFGPIIKPFNRKLAKHIVNKVDIITVRDHGSKEKLGLLGVKRDVTITADVTFAMDLPPKEVIETIYRDEKIDETKKMVGVSVRRWYGEDTYKRAIARICEELIDRNYEVIFIPMQYPEDTHISREIADLMNKKPKIIESRYNPEEIIGIISRLDLLIGMRLHSLVFAAVAAVPMVGLEYDPKILSFLNLVKQRSAGKVENLDITHLREIVDEVINTREEYKRNLMEIRDELREKAELNIKILEQFIKKGEKR
ncbi:MAG: polysaccharide pyruvyl transferase CsaB [Natronincolaceae bacterium]|jgi:polysaccharide pyruvyl transferase CsaB|nr:polysaccharide pyruvyl transferase CsaB [Bacillota bacterium]NLK90696.1 polysaccharide pyruvyl transferase CsaB [Clostridiales bacterium]